MKLLPCFKHAVHTGFNGLTTWFLKEGFQNWIINFEWDQFLLTGLYLHPLLAGTTCPHSTQTLPMVLPVPDLTGGLADLTGSLQIIRVAVVQVVEQAVQ